jgi:CRISPR-associated protein Cas5h
MIPDKVLCFELFGDYAQFRKFFTNMSPLSFSIPPRTVLSGIIGAILGISKHENPETFAADNSFIAIRLMNPVRKVRIAHNYIKTTSPSQVFEYKSHKPTNIEFLKNVRYRVYFACTSPDLYAKLKQMLISHRSVYTICLGISGCIADFQYLGEYYLEQRPALQRLMMNSAIPMPSVHELLIDSPLKLQKVVAPTFMNNDRTVSKYEEVLFEMNGAPIPMISSDTSYLVKELNDIIHAL